MVKDSNDFVRSLTEEQKAAFENLQKAEKDFVDVLSSAQLTEYTLYNRDQMDNALTARDENDPTPKNKWKKTEKFVYIIVPE